MSLVNRCSMLIYPLEPFYEWQSELFPDDLMEFPDEPLKDEAATVFLIPVLETEFEFDKWIKKNYKKFLKGILNDWVTDQTLWPKKLTYELFIKWFHVSFHSMVYDTLDTSIIKEEDSDDEDFFKQ